MFLMYFILLTAAGILAAYLYARESRKLKYLVQRAHVVWNDSCALKTHYYERRQKKMAMNHLVAWREAILRKHDDA